MYQLAHPTPPFGERVGINIFLQAKSVLSQFLLCFAAKIPPKLIHLVFVSRGFTPGNFVTPLSGVCFTSAINQ